GLPGRILDPDLPKERRSRSIGVRPVSLEMAKPWCVGCLGTHGQDVPSSYALRASPEYDAPTSSRPLKHSPNDLLDRHFLHHEILNGQFVQHRLYGANNPISLDF